VLPLDRNTPVQFSTGVFAGWPPFRGNHSDWLFIAFSVTSDRQFNSTGDLKIMSTTGKGYIVRRMTQDGDKGGQDTYHYQKVANPEPGELIYHGEFVSRQVELADNGPMGSVYGTVYVPVDPSKVTSEPFNGGADVETF
jgi:hypothetical protein